MVVQNATDHLVLADALQRTFFGVFRHSYGDQVELVEDDRHEQRRIVETAEEQQTSHDMLRADGDRPEFRHVKRLDETDREGQEEQAKADDRNVPVDARGPWRSLVFARDLRQILDEVPHHEDVGFHVEVDRVEDAVHVQDPDDGTVPENGTAHGGGVVPQIDQPQQKEHEVDCADTPQPDLVDSRYEA